MKTAREWFQHLPEPYRTQAFKYDNKDFDMEVGCMYDALYYGFKWHTTDEGGDYWSSLALNYFV